MSDKDVVCDRVLGLAEVKAGDMKNVTVEVHECDHHAKQTKPF